MKVTVQPVATQAETVRIAVDREYLEGIQLEGMVPEPESVESGADQVIFVFSVREPNEPMTIMFDIEPETIGVRTLRLGLDGDQPLNLRQIVFP